MRNDLLDEGEVGLNERKYAGIYDYQFFRDDSENDVGSNNGRLLISQNADSPPIRDGKVSNLINNN